MIVACAFEKNIAKIIVVVVRVAELVFSVKIRVSLNEVKKKGLHMYSCLL